MAGLAALVMAWAGPAAGNQMPVMDKEPWEGYFVGYQRRDFRFGIYANGEGHLIPLGRRRQRVSRSS